MAAMSTVEVMGLDIAPEHYERLFKGAEEPVRMRVLDVLLQRPHAELTEFVKSVATDDKFSWGVRTKAVHVMGVLAKNDPELLEYLRETADMGGARPLMRRAAIEGLFFAEDYECLSNLCVQFYDLEDEAERVRFILSKLQGITDRASFIKLYKFYRNKDYPTNAMGLMLAKATLGCFEQADDTLPLYTQLKTRVAKLLRSQDAEEFQFALNLVSDLGGGDVQFLTKVVTSFLTGKVFRASIEKQKMALFKQYLEEHASADKVRKAVSGVFEKMIQTCCRTLEEQQKAHRGIYDEREKKRLAFTEFFQSLCNAKVLETVMVYLKSNGPDYELRAKLAAVLKKLAPTLNKRQKERFPIVLKLLMEDDARLRTFLSAGCSRIKFEESPEVMFEKLKMLCRLGVYFRDEKILALWKHVYQLAKQYHDTEKLQHGILQLYISSGKSKYIQMGFNEILINLDKVDKKLFSNLPPVEQKDIAFLKEFFTNETHVELTILSIFVDLLSSVVSLTDKDWIRILIRMEQGEFGQLPTPIKKQINRLLAGSGVSLSLEHFNKRLRDKNYKLTDEDLELVFVFSEGLGTNAGEKQDVFKDLLYGCLQKSNLPYYPELGYILLLLGEKYGKVLLDELLAKEDVSVLCKTIRYMKQAKIGTGWKKILGFLDSSSFLLHNQVVDYFEEEFKEFNKESLDLMILKRLGGGQTDEVASVVDESDEDHQHLQTLFDEMEHSKLGNKAKFGVQQNMKELTIFFIDIAGYTKRCNTSTQIEIIEMLKEFGGIIEPIGERFNGTLIKKIGDCFMYTFERRLEALLFSLQIQKELKATNEFRVERERINTRVGLATGEVYCMDNDVYGDFVNLASRVESKAPINGVLAHETTMKGMHDFFDSKTMDLIQVKGIADPIQTYHVITPKLGILDMYFGTKNGQ
jgi:class 3 adenylate cyclase